MTDRIMRYTRTIHPCTVCNQPAPLFAGVCEHCRTELQYHAALHEEPAAHNLRYCEGCGGDDTRCPYCWGGKGTG